MDDTVRDPYTILDVSPTASLGEVQTAYRLLQTTYHPEAWITKPQAQREYAARKLEQVLWAGDKVGNATSRAKWDTTVAQTAASPPPPAPPPPPGPRPQAPEAPARPQEPGPPPEPRYAGAKATLCGAPCDDGQPCRHPIGPLGRCPAHGARPRRCQLAAMAAMTARSKPEGNATVSRPGRWS